MEELFLQKLDEQAKRMVELNRQELGVQAKRLEVLFQQQASSSRQRISNGQSAWRGKLARTTSACFTQYASASFACRRLS